MTAANCALPSKPHLLLDSCLLPQIVIVDPKRPKMKAKCSPFLAVTDTSVLRAAQLNRGRLQLARLLVIEHTLSTQETLDSTSSTKREKVIPQSWMSLEPWGTAEKSLGLSQPETQQQQTRTQPEPGGRQQPLKN